MRKNKIGALFLVSTLALAGLGISYAGFSDIITVYGIVDTATVDLEIEEYSCTYIFKIWNFEPGFTPPVYTGLTVNKTGKIAIYYGPCVAPGTLMALFDDLCEIDLISWATSTQTMGGEPEEPIDDSVSMTFWNLFPCIDFKADVIVHYTGSIPAHVGVTDLVWDLTGDNFDFTPYTTFTYTFVDERGFPIRIPYIEPVQMHYCDYLAIEVTIHIPQNNDLQGLHGEFSFDIQALQWNDQCEETTKDEIITLPDGIYGVVLDYPGTMAFIDATLSGIPAGNPYVWDDTWPCWCADEDHYIYPDDPYLAKLYSTYDPANPHPDSDWPKVNWIINHKADYPSATFDDFQDAIWYFVDHGDMPSGIGATIVADANANGATFKPQTGQLIAVLLWPVDEYGDPVDLQWTFIEVDP